MIGVEVRFHMLRPEQITQRRVEFPVVYIPLGTLEWHGLHNPLGADGLQAETLAVRCAEKGGGLVFPTLYYGESRAGITVIISYIFWLKPLHTISAWPCLS
jgi:creatinine amidohydrolase